MREHTLACPYIRLRRPSVTAETAVTRNFFACLRGVRLALAVSGPPAIPDYHESMVAVAR